MTADRSIENVLAGVPATYRQIDHWVRAGYLRPQGGIGTGNPREWTREELRVFRRMARLVNAGLQPAAAAKAARAGALPQLAPGVHLLITGDDPVATP